MKEGKLTRSHKLLLFLLQLYCNRFIAFILQKEYDTPFVSFVRNALTFDPTLSGHAIHPVVFVATAGLVAVQVNTQLIAHISLQAWINL